MERAQKTFSQNGSLAPSPALSQLLILPLIPPPLTASRFLFKALWGEGERRGKHSLALCEGGREEVGRGPCPEST